MSKHKAIKSVSFLWLGSLVGSGSTFIIYMILARHLGVEKFGVFSSSLATVTVLSLVSGLGVSQSWLKHFGMEGWNALRWLPSSFKLVIISIVFVLCILILWALFGPHDNITKNLLLILSSFAIGQMIIELVSVKFQLEEKYSKLALWQLFPNLLRLIIVSIMYTFTSYSFDVIDVSYIYALVSMIFIFSGIFQLYQMNSKKFDLQGHGDKIKSLSIIPTTKEVLSHSWAFGLASIFAFIYLQSDIIMVKYLVDDKEAGLYNVGFVLMTAILIFPTVFYQKFLMPKVHRWATQDRDKFYDTYKRGNIVMLIAAIVVIFCVYMLSGIFVPILFGKEYINAIPLVNILSLSLPFYFMAYNIGTTLVTQEHMKEKVKIMGSIALINLILNLFLIPIYGAMGAAISTVLSNVLLSVFYYLYAEKKVFIDRKGN